MCSLEYFSCSYLFYIVVTVCVTCVILFVYELCNVQYGPMLLLVIYTIIVKVSFICLMYY